MKRAKSSRCLEQILMFYELARAFVQKIFQDKILAGLVIVGILAIFVGGFGGGATDRIASGPRDDRQKSQASSLNEGENSANPALSGPAKPQAAASAPQTSTKLEPVLAAQFVSWWLGTAMDFNPQTALKNRQQALAWVSPDVAPSYQAAFWPPEIQDGVLSGRLHGSYTPTSVQAIASNPDGSVVVQVNGQLVLQQGPRPAVQQLSTDYLVKREAGGLRISGLYNRIYTVPGNSIY